MLDLPMRLNKEKGQTTWSDYTNTAQLSQSLLILGLLGVIPAHSAVYKGAKKASNSVEIRGQKTAPQAQASPGTNLHGDYPHQEKMPCWSSPMSQGCHPTHSHHTPALGTILCLHLRLCFSQGRSLPILQLLLTALLGPHKTCVAAASSDPFRMSKQ